MSTLDTLIVWNDQQLAAFRESGASSTYELFVAKPELFPKEVQDTYF